MSVEPLNSLDEILPLLGATARVLHAPGEGEDGDRGGGDVDCAVRDLDPLWPLRLPTPYRLLQCVRYDIAGWYWVLERGGEIVKLDTLDDPDAIGLDGLSTESVLQAEETKFDAVRAAYLTAKRLRKGATDAREWEYVRSLAEADREEFSLQLNQIFGDIAGELAEAVDRATAPEPEVRRRARRQILLRRLGNPATAGRVAVRSIARIADRVARPTGFTVLIVGPDGAGKSTVATRLPDICAGPFRRSLHLHWRPGVLPSLGRLSRSDASEPTNPHVRSPHGRLISGAALAYYWADFIIGSWVRIAPTRVRSGLVVVERGWWDIAVDPTRYRMRVPEQLVRLLGSLLPRPDLVIVLTAPERVISERKQEIALDEVRRQTQAWKRLVPRRVGRIEIDASAPIDDVGERARDEIFARLSSRAMRRLGAGWTAISPSRRWLFPRGPRTAAAAALSIYQPVTTRARMGWGAARLAARVGAFRLLPHGEAPSARIREAIAKFVPRGATLASMRANHPGRHVVAVVDQHGRTSAIVKVADDDEGRARLRAEAESLDRLAPYITPPVTAPRVIAHEDGVLVLEPVAWRPRPVPSMLPIDVARACGLLYRRTASADGSTGAAHGDLAPWNVLRTETGWTLVDWEDASEDAAPFTDVLHYLVQAHALLRRPTKRDLLQSVRTGRGTDGAAIRVYALAAGVAAGVAYDVLHAYLERTLPTLDPATKDGHRGIRARRALLAAMEAEEDSASDDTFGSP
jgi:thymidylate kinase